MMRGMTHREELERIAKQHQWLVSDVDSWGDVWFGRHDRYLQAHFDEAGQIKWGNITGNKPLLRGQRDPDARFAAAKAFLRGQYHG